MQGRTSTRSVGGLPRHVYKVLQTRIAQGSTICDLHYRSAYQQLAHLLDVFGVATSVTYAPTLRRLKAEIDAATEGGIKPRLLARLEDHLKKNRTEPAEFGASGGRPNDRCLRRFGFTLDAYVAHVDALFQPGMTWMRLVAGEVQVGYILPVRIFDLSTREGVHAAYALSNTQPLWRGDNARKGRTVDREWIALFGEGTIRG